MRLQAARAAAWAWGVWPAGSADGLRRDALVAAGEDAENRTVQVGDGGRVGGDTAIANDDRLEPRVAASGVQGVAPARVEADDADCLAVDLRPAQQVSHCPLQVAQDALFRQGPVQDVRLEHILAQLAPVEIDRQHDIALVRQAFGLLLDPAGQAPVLVNDDEGRGRPLRRRLVEDAADHVAARRVRDASLVDLD